MLSEVNWRLTPHLYSILNIIVNRSSFSKKKILETREPSAFRKRAENSPSSDADEETLERPDWNRARSVILFQFTNSDWMEALRLIGRLKKVVPPADEESAYESFKAILKLAREGFEEALEELDHLYPLIKYMGWDKDPEFRELCEKKLIDCE